MIRSSSRNPIRVCLAVAAIVALPSSASAQSSPHDSAPADISAFRRWERRVLQPYVAQQLRRLRDEATPRYRDVIAMRVPSWEIAAYARLAEMFDRFARDLRDAPVPPDIERNELLLQEYLAARERAVQQFEQPAEEGFRACIERATQVRWFSDWSQRCERGLNALNARQYPLADELRVAPGLVASRPATARPVYEIAAEPTDE